MTYRKRKLKIDKAKYGKTSNNILSYTSNMSISLKSILKNFKIFGRHVTENDLKIPTAASVSLPAKDKSRLIIVDTETTGTYKYQSPCTPGINV